MTGVVELEDRVGFASFDQLLPPHSCCLRMFVQRRPQAPIGAIRIDPIYEL